MTQEQSDYQSEVDEAMAMLGEGYDQNQPAVIIERATKGVALNGNVLSEIKVWGWVKISANFIHHIRLLRGAKHAVWEVIALSIDENGECKFSLKELVSLTGYSRSEVSESLRELDKMGYLTIQKAKGKSSIYRPSFAARGGGSPTTIPIQKSDGYTHPVSTHRYPSSPAIEKLHSTIKELKESLYIPDFQNMTPKEAVKLATLKLYKEATGFFPGELIWESVHNVILENNLTYYQLHTAAVAWMGRGFKRENVSGILEWAIKGIPEFKSVITQRKTPIQSRQAENQAALDAMQFDEEGKIIHVNTK